MAKDRYAVTCNGRTAFYACMWEDIRQCAMDCGWAVSLHGSLASDMDIMAMPWVDNAVSFKEMIDRVSKLFKDNDMSSQYVITYNEKPHNRVVATIPIWSDFYLDISTINTADVVPRAEVELLKRQLEPFKEVQCFTCKHYDIGHDHVPCCYCKDYDKYIWLSADADTDIHASNESEVDKDKAEVAMEIFEEIANMTVLQHGFNENHIVAHIDFERLKELKKKYTEGETE